MDEEVFYTGVILMVSALITFLSFLSLKFIHIFLHLKKIFSHFEIDASLFILLILVVGASAYSFNTFEHEIYKILLPVLYLVLLKQSFQTSKRLIYIVLPTISFFISLYIMIGTSKKQDKYLNNIGYPLIMMVMLSTLFPIKSSNQHKLISSAHIILSTCLIYYCRQFERQVDSSWIRQCVLASTMGMLIISHFFRQNLKQAWFVAVLTIYLLIESTSIIKMACLPILLLGIASVQRQFDPKEKKKIKIAEILIIVMATLVHFKAAGYNFVLSDMHLAEPQYTFPKNMALVSFIVGLNNMMPFLIPLFYLLVRFSENLEKRRAALFMILLYYELYVMHKVGMFFIQAYINCTPFISFVITQSFFYYGLSYVSIIIFMCVTKIQMIKSS